MATINRQRIAVDGATAVLDAFVTAVTSGPGDGIAAARALDRLGSSVDWASIRDQVVASKQSIVIAEHPDGPVLAAKWFAPAVPTTTHDHGWPGAALLVEGTCRYERFERLGQASARLESIHDLRAGEVSWWNAPPDDVHRQVALGNGALELVLLAGAPTEPADLADVAPAPVPFRAAVTEAWLNGHASLLVPWYAEDVLGDLNVPGWRFQVRGREALLGLLDAEEFTQPDRRLSTLRLTDAADGMLVETETRFSADGSSRWFREVHRLRCRNGLVVEHTAWCTGIAGADAAAAQLHTAPMERM